MSELQGERDMSTPEPTLSDSAPVTGEVTREELHERRINMRGYRRSDGLYEVEGRVIDEKPHDFTAPGMGGRTTAAHESIHEMGVVLVFDEDLLVHDVRTFTVASPYRECTEGGRALAALKGLRIASGWNREIRNRLGPGTSCTHLVELLVPLATVAFQTLSLARVGRPDTLDKNGRPLKVDSCYAYREGGELVLHHWPTWHRPEAAKD